LAAVFDARILRILRAAGCSPEIIGKPQRIGDTMSYAGLFGEAQLKAFARRWEAKARFLRQGRGNWPSRASEEDQRGISAGGAQSARQTAPQSTEKIEFALGNGWAEDFRILYSAVPDDGVTAFRRFAGRRLTGRRNRNQESEIFFRTDFRAAMEGGMDVHVLLSTSLLVVILPIRHQTANWGLTSTRGGRIGKKSESTRTGKDR
jgi:hypothetical protein